MTRYHLKSRRIQDAIDSGYSFVATSTYFYVYKNNNIVYSIALTKVINHLTTKTITYNFYLDIIKSKSKYKSPFGINTLKHTRFVLFDYIFNTAVSNYFEPKF